MPRYSRRLIVRTGSLVPLATVLAGCGTGVSGDAQGSVTQPGKLASSTGGTLTRAMTSEPATIDPQGPVNSGMNLVLPYLFDTLITRRRDGSYAGQLAESWQVGEGGRTIDFKLKPGVKFHDGTKLDAAAVVFTFERFKRTGDRSPIASGIQAISRLEALNDSTIRFHFDQPTATIWGTLSMPYAAILSPTAVQAAGDDMGQRPVGTGALKLGEWKRGVSLTLLRNPDYAWGPPEVQNRGPVHIEKLIFQVIPDATTQFAALQAGEVDVFFVNEPSHLARVEQDRNLRVEKVNIDALIYLGYNCARPPFDDVKVRQAFSHAVNKADVIKLGLGGLGAEAPTPLVPSMLGYNADLKRYGQGHDPVKARSLLREAGFTAAPDGTWQRDGKKLTAKLLTSNRAPNDVIATLLQSQFKAIGIPVEIQQLDSAAVMRSTNEGGFDLLLWRYDWNDPDVLNIYLSSNRIRQTNRVFYGNSEVDALLERGTRELDQKKRSDLYQAAQKIILAEAPWQPLYTPVEGLALRNRVKGMVVGAQGRMLINDVTLSGG
jgi:peptide/nickel transport system substrate-binding protein